MKTIKLYGFADCPHCPPAKEFLQKHNIPYEYHDVKASDSAMTEFRKLRDTLTNIDFEGKIGVPAFTFGNKIIIGLDEEKILAAYAFYNAN